MYSDSNKDSSSVMRIDIKKRDAVRNFVIYTVEIMGVSEYSVSRFFLNLFIFLL